MDTTSFNFSRFEGLMPVVALVRRELLTTLRSSRSFLFLASILAMMTALLTFYLLEAGRVELLDTMAMSELTQFMYYTFSYGLYLAGMLLAPPIAASAICLEKQQERLDLIRMTYIRPGELIFGKMLNIVGLFTVFAIAALPFAGVMLFFTGLDAQQYTQAILLVFFAVGSSSMLGLMFSAWFYRTVPSMMATYLAILLTQSGTAAVSYVFFVLVFSRGNFNAINWDVMNAGLSTLCPWVGLEEIRMRSLPAAFYLAVPLYHGGIMVLAAWKTRRLLDRPMAPMKVDTRKPIDDPVILEARRRKFPYYLLDPQRRRALIGDNQNPVYVKERYTGLANRGTTAIRILYGTAMLAVSIGLFMPILIEAGESGLVYASGFLFFETLLLVGVAPAFVATAISKEREWGNWDILRSTLLTPTQVIFGKLRAILVTLALPGAALLIGSLPLLAAAGRYPDVLDGLVFGIVMMLVTIFYVVSISLAIATAQEKSLSALLAAYGACFVLLIVIPVMALAWTELTPVMPGDPMSAQKALWLSPLTMPPALLLGDSRFRYEHAVPLATPYVLSHVLTVLLLSLAMLRASIGTCDRMWRGPRVTRIEAAAQHHRERSAP